MAHLIYIPGAELTSDEFAALLAAIGTHGRRWSTWLTTAFLTGDYSGIGPEHHIALARLSRLPGLDIERTVLRGVVLAMAS
jgi:hypothetical protein